MARAPRTGQPAPGGAVHRITGARQSLSEDINARQVRYIASMGVRTLCFILAIVTSGWWRGIFFVGAILLPYVAVVIANGSRPQAGPDVDAIAPPTRTAIEPAPPERPVL